MCDAMFFHRTIQPNVKYSPHAFLFNLRTSARKSKSCYLLPWRGQSQKYWAAALRRLICCEWINQRRLPVGTILNYETHHTVVLGKMLSFRMSIINDVFPLLQYTFFIVFFLSKRCCYKSWLWIQLQKDSISSHGPPNYNQSRHNQPLKCFCPAVILKFLSYTILWPVHIAFRPDRQSGRVPLHVNMSFGSDRVRSLS